MIEHPPSVTLVVTDADRLVVVRQFRPGAAGTVLELPAGTLEPGETLEQAADRELAEECGLAVSGWTIVGSFWAAPAYSSERVTVLAGSCSGTAEGTPDADEQISVEWVSLTAARAGLEDASSVAALALWDSHRGNAP